MNVLEYLKKTSVIHAHKKAIVDGEKIFTFKELAHSAYNLGQIIKEETNNQKNRPIAVLLPKSAECVLSYLAILFSNNIYVPLDEASPSERLNRILLNLENPLIITNNHFLNHFNDLFQNKNVLNIDQCSLEPAEEINWQFDVVGKDPMYIIHTSGSTGTPKGVIISHESLIDYINYLKSRFQINHTHNIGSQSPMYFDNSTFDMYLMLSTGATMHIIPKQFYAFPTKLVDYFNKHKITTVLWVPTVFGIFEKLDVLNKKKLKYLKLMCSAGEKLLPHHINYWLEHLPNVQYYNLYGPTEITATCTIYEIQEKVTQPSVPIGKAHDNLEILILNENNQISKPNEMGELCVKGTCLSLGYWNDPEKTKEVFVQNPLNNNFNELIYRTGDLVKVLDDGNIEFIGRKDNQIKHKGYRIELGEIESAAISLDVIDNCCVVYDSMKQAILLYYEGNETLTLSTLNESLMKKIPKYMLPNKILFEPELKRNPSGKIDRKYYKCKKEVNDETTNYRST